MAPDAPGGPGNIVTVLITADISAGWAAKGMLEAGGIPVVVKGEVEGPLPVGPMYLLVPEEFEAEARLLLEEAERAGGAGEPEPGSNGSGG